MSTRSSDKKMESLNQTSNDDANAKTPLVGDDTLASHSVEEDQASTYGEITKAVGYAKKHQFNDAPADDSDLDEDEREQTKDLTPMTKRRVINEKEIKDVKKLGKWATVFTLFKGFVASSILYMPKNFINGGWLLSPLALILSMTMTLYCAKLLIEVNEKVGGGSFSSLGLKILGKPGKILTDIALFGSQFGFVTAYVYFIAKESQSVIQCITNTDTTDPMLCPDGVLVPKYYFLPICMFIYVPLVLVRKIEKFAKFHLFGDIMIAVSLGFISVFAAERVQQRGGFTDYEIKMINYKLWPDAIGFSVYAFEGIGIILPVQDVTADKKNYYTRLCGVVITICVMFIAFGEFCIFSYGNYGPENPEGLENPLIIDSLPAENPAVWMVKIFFSLNLVFSYPLMLAPANVVLESYLFGSWGKTRKRQCCKNLTRTITVLATCLVAISIWDDLDKFLSIVGALTCTPIAFILPATFHLKTCAVTFRQKCIDVFLIVLAFSIMIFCTIFGIVTWNE